MKVDVVLSKRLGLVVGDVLIIAFEHTGAENLAIVYNSSETGDGEFSELKSKASSTTLIDVDTAPTMGVNSYHIPFMSYYSRTTDDTIELA